MTSSRDSLDDGQLEHILNSLIVPWDTSDLPPNVKIMSPSVKVQQAKQAIHQLIVGARAEERDKHFQEIIPDEGVDETTKGTFADGYTKAVEDICNRHYALSNKLKGDIDES